MFYLELVLVVIFIAFALSAIIGVPFLQTHLPQAKRMVELAELKPGMTALDLGSGAGRLMFLAAQSGAKVIGYELNPFLALLTKFRIIKKGLKNSVSVRCQSLYNANLKSADVVFVFLFPKPMARLAPRFFSELKPGAKIISYAFKIPDRIPVHEEQGIFVYTVPQK